MPMSVFFDNETNSAADLSNLTFGATVNGSAIAVGGAVEGNYYKITGLTPGRVNNVRVISDAFYRSLFHHRDKIAASQFGYGKLVSPEWRIIVLVDRLSRSR